MYEDINITNIKAFAKAGSASVVKFKWAQSYLKHIAHENWLCLYMNNNTTF